eukprot:1707131-Pyramimonas_sp.AAC.1
MEWMVPPLCSLPCWALPPRGGPPGLGSSPARGALPGRRRNCGANPGPSRAATSSPAPTRRPRGRARGRG